MENQTDKQIRLAKQREWYQKRKNGFVAKNPGRPASTPEVLWSKVDKKSEDECWPWIGMVTKSGYGRTWINDKGYYAHRVIYDLVYPNTISLNAPKVSEEFGFVLHICDNPVCCNPKHLFLGNHSDNMADKKRKGRVPDFSGGKGPRCMLTMEQARQARQMKKDGKSTRDLAKLFGISLSAIKTLIRGDSYKE